MRRLTLNKLTKQILCAFLSFALILGNITIVQADEMDLNCKSAILVDAASGEVIVEKNPHEKLPPASVTKVMTMLLIMEAVDSGKITFEDKVTISKQAESKNSEGTMLLLEAGEVRTVHELLLGIAVESANDACIAMAEYISGSEEEFVKLMNKRAQELGMNDTNFMNPNGLHEDGHVTSAYDIGLMSRALVKHDKIFNYISQYMVDVHIGKKNDVLRSLTNKNKMVRFYQGFIDGIKTGYTRQAMYCISLSAKKNNLRLISVIMGAPDVPIRTKEAKKLLDYGFANYSNYSVAKAGDVVAETQVSKGDMTNIKVVSNDEISVLIKKGEDKSITKEIKLPSMLVAPIKKDQQLGEMILLKDGKEIAKFALVSSCDVNKSSFFINLRKSFEYWFGANN
ncbi:MAG: D-alanyl-D-alanine carboxypeptidase [Clostridia bacterium]|jgi:D-alanyl-D-alanine carboxypeptidase (penicillin-binding protein 5/6)|nr:D-alanyl-D-alanine carboxypeptidase [Clostridia bacterium]